MASLLVASKFVTKITAGLFTGGSLYCAVVEHPGRMKCDTRIAATVFPPCFMRAAPLQAVLGMISGACAGYLYYVERDNKWLAISLLFFSILPYTNFVLMPINRKLLDKNVDKDSPNTKALLESWGNRNLVRTFIGFAGFILAVLQN